MSILAARAPLVSRFPVHLNSGPLGRPRILHLRKLCVDDIRVLMPVINAHPHLPLVSRQSQGR
jgi:hypothetical protein